MSSNADNVPEIPTATITDPLPETSDKSDSTKQAEKGTKHPSEIWNRQTLHELVTSIDPNEQLDDDVEDFLLKYAEEYMESVIEGAAQLATHRKSTTVEVRDVQMHLERTSNMIWIPGFGTDELKTYKRSPLTEAHKQRTAIIKKTLKKY